MRFVLAVFGSWLFASSCAEAPAIPDPDTSSMEPEVAREIAARRGAVSSEPRSSGRWGELGMVFQAHELYREAKTSYAAARGLDERDFRWPYLEARCSLSLQEIEPAIEAVREAIELEPGYAPLYVVEAELHEKANRLDDAVASYRKALAIDARLAAAELGIGRIELARGDVDASLQHLERAAELEPGSGSIQAMLARALNRAGDREPARAAAELARALPPVVGLEDRVMASVLERSVSVSGYQRRAAEAEARGDFGRAEELLRHLVALRPREADFHYNLANHLSRTRRVEAAAETYRKALELDPEHPGALVNLGILRAQAGERPEARALFGKALERDPEHAGALASLGRLLALEGDFPSAVRYFERALSSDPRQVETRYALAQVLRRQGRLEEAIAELSRAIALAPRRGDIQLDLATALAASGDYPAAWDHVRRARESGVAPPEDFIAALTSRMREPADP
jgi:tetratricopeptide (TPR) repeat protein